VPIVGAIPNPTGRKDTMRSKQRVVRLNEAGLRRLVREMVNGMGAGPNPRAAQELADDFLTQYLNARDSYGGLDSIPGGLYQELAREMESIARTALGPGNGTVKVRMSQYDDEMEIMVSDWNVNGQPQRPYAGDLEGLIGLLLRGA
jgi:hypothetical protein